MFDKCSYLAIVSGSTIKELFKACFEATTSVEKRVFFIMYKIDEVRPFTEEWRDINDYEGIYQVSSYGRVKSLYKRVRNGKGYRHVGEIILSLSKDNKGYKRVGLSKMGKQKTHNVHQLVAVVFLNHKPNGHKLVVNHKNFTPSDNFFKNLELVSNRVNSNKKHIKSSSKYTGVTWYKNVEKWVSRIHINGKQKSLGYYDKEYDAHLAYEKALAEIKNLS